MNERMIELHAESCEFAYKICKENGREGGIADQIWYTLSTGKFAELIVRECAGIYEGVYTDQARPERIDTRIKQHFGVEE